MSTQEQKPPRGLIPWPKLAEKYGRTTRTLDNWVADKILDEPVRINGRKYGKADEAPKNDPAA
jgi:hypothetical protein